MTKPGAYTLCSKYISQNSDIYIYMARRHLDRSRISTPYIKGLNSITWLDIIKFLIHSTNQRALLRDFRQVRCTSQAIHWNTNIMNHVIYQALGGLVGLWHPAVMVSCHRVVAGSNPARGTFFCLHTAWLLHNQIPYINQFKVYPGAFGHLVNLKRYRED